MATGQTLVDPGVMARLVGDGDNGWRRGERCFVHSSVLKMLIGFLSWQSSLTLSLETLFCSWWTAADE